MRRTRRERIALDVLTRARHLRTEVKKCFLNPRVSDDLPFSNVLSKRSVST